MVFSLARWGLLIHSSPSDLCSWFFVQWASCNLRAIFGSKISTLAIRIEAIEHGDVLAFSCFFFFSCLNSEGLNLLTGIVNSGLKFVQTSCVRPWTFQFMYMFYLLEQMPLQHPHNTTPRASILCASLEVSNPRTRGTC